MSEQEIISKYFSRHQPDDLVDIGIGDDAAVVASPDNTRLVITTDTLNEGVHFFSDCLPEYIGHKALAVNLSDLAAMGATPLWATINLSLPEIRHTWLSSFSDGLFALANENNIKIIGGDLVRGSLSISIQAIGYVPLEKVLTRSNAVVDNHVFVSGIIGNASLGLKLHEENLNLELTSEEKNELYNSLYKPISRINLGLNILNFASAAIDISDGLLQDLQRLTTLSQVAAEIDIEKIPISRAMQTYIETSQDWSLPLIGGEDYELLFTADEKYRAQIKQISERIRCPITDIGQIVQGKGISIYKSQTKMALPKNLGFDHFQ